MSSSFDHILLIGFGGPESPEQIMPFLEQVTAGRNIPKNRLLSVAEHYKVIGGKSPYNAWAARLAEQIRESPEIKLPVFLGYRNTPPFLNEQVLAIHQQGLKKGVGVFLAPFRSSASCKRYKQNIHEALHRHGIVNLEYGYLEPWYRDQDYIALVAALAREKYESIPHDLRKQTEIIFSCHSIPSHWDSDCHACIYSAEYETAVKLTGEQAVFEEWKHAYQSRSGDPSQPWLAPDLLDVLKESAEREKKAVMVIPMGFLSDNAEVLYDLDIEAKAAAEKLGLKFFRAQTPGNHPDLARMFVKLIGRRLEGQSSFAECSV